MPPRKFKSPNSNGVQAPGTCCFVIGLLLVDYAIPWSEKAAGFPVCFAPKALDFAPSAVICPVRGREETGLAQLPPRSPSLPCSWPASRKYHFSETPCAPPAQCSLPTPLCPQPVIWPTEACLTSVTFIGSWVVYTWRKYIAHSRHLMSIWKRNRNDMLDDKWNLIHTASRTKGFMWDTFLYITPCRSHSSFGK